MGTVNHHAHLTGINEEHLAGVLLPAVEEPYADRYRHVIEQLVWHGDDTLHEVCLNEAAAYVALTSRGGGQGTVGKHQTYAARRREVVHHVLNPCVVGIALRRHSVLPAHVVGKAAGTPVLHVERRICHDEVKLLRGMLVIAEGVAPAVAEVGVKSADGKVHVCHLPRIGIKLLTVYRHVAQVALMLLNELGTLHEHTARTAGRVIHPALKRLQHLDDGAHYARRSIELAP